MTASGSVRIVREPLQVVDGVPLFVVVEWAERFPWLVAATTGAGDDGDFDLGLFGNNPVGDALARWRALIAATRMSGAAHSRQAHESRVQSHAAVLDGLLVSDRYDGHVTSASGLLLTVSIADCVPVLLVDEETRSVAALHAGWRGVAAGVLERGIARLSELTGARPERLWLHAGPSICGDCYEVRPEVHEAIGRPRPRTNTPIDLRAALASRAFAQGLGPERVTISAHCTKCGPGRFFSHRAGQRGRQMGMVGVRR